MSSVPSWGKPMNVPWPAEDRKPAGEFDHMTRDQILLEWDRRKKALDAAKEGELAIRKAIAAREFPNPKKGTNNLELGNGYTLKLVHKVNYNLAPDNAKVEEVQEAIEKVGNEGKFLADRLITWKPTLSVSEYGKLDLEDPTHRKIKELVDSVVTMTDATPSLEIKEPKSK